MKFVLLALLASALAVAAQVPIPYTNCGAPSDHIKIASASASTWPPAIGSSVTISIAGALDEQLNSPGGSYILDVSFDGFPIVNQQGSLTDLGIPFPVPKGPFNMSKTVTVPSVVPGGSQVFVNVSALDTNGQELICISIQIDVPSETEFDSDFEYEESEEEPEYYQMLESDDGAMSDADFENSIFDLYEPATEEEAITMKSIVSGLETIISGPMEIIYDDMLQDTPIPVPYTNCGQSSDIIQIQSITSTVWPPVMGATTALAINFVAREEIADGNYEAVVSVDGFPLVDKKGDISKYFKLPIEAGPVSIAKNITLPSLPISGSIGIQLSAVDTSSDELFCLQLSFDI